MQALKQDKSLCNKLKLQWITDATTFYQLKLDWNKLASYYPTQFYFRHEWFDSAWQWAQTLGQLKILTVYDHDQLIAIVPLLLKNIIYKGIPFKQLEFLTVPDTQMCDIIISPPYYATGTFILEYILKDKSWDKLKLHYLKPNSLLSLFSQMLSQSFTLEVTTQHPIVRINENWDSFYATKGRRLKKGNNLCRNHLEKEGTVVLENLIYLPKNELLQVIQRISQHSWKQSTHTTFDQKAPYAFIKRLTELALEKHWLNVWGLRVNHEIIALEYHIEYSHQIYALRADYLTSKASLSPGTYLNWKILETLFEQKKSIYYMGPGKNTYKNRWQNYLEDVWTFSSFNKTICGTLLKTIEQSLIPRLRIIKDKAQILT
ncbi:GNAT family N-acetyltransferase [Candidatus Berkiella cookevillensis]|uniref:GNAT family N-acetyltransferase n=1 Tax=Candidatus Berkiella cookevillensis TaxID=437022 RepID=A0A0Q9YP96_9GAMM|nr:GNAT family N-acetyltransferase [Candidatus Berkiella cookevillensis]MCS5709117.1 GNAT family N-acetyltransferase [Candidatus Berkiella cookevillensis]